MWRLAKTENKALVRLRIIHDGTSRARQEKTYDFSKLA